VENCHWGRKVPYKPNATWCPWNFYRTSGDVRANYASVVNNLQTTIPYAEQHLSRPGCWAYPDMLEVGVLHTPFSSDKGLTIEETRAHFGAWVIVSSPLTLSHDVNNQTIQDAIWPLISNKEVLAVSQCYAGHSGSPFKASSEMVVLPREKELYGKAEESGPVSIPAFQYFYKPMLEGGAKTAVLLMNHAADSVDLALSFADIPSVKCSKCKVRDIWNHKDLGTFDGSYTAKGVKSHDAVFLVVTPA